MRPDVSQGREENPFFVLELPLTATSLEVERQKQKLLGMLELDLKQAARFETPAGQRERTSELVRRAAEQLRDPARRLVWELWGAGRSGGDQEAPLPAAVAAHGALEDRIRRHQKIDAEAVDAVGLAWDEALEAEETWDEASSRAATLELDGPDAALEALGDGAFAELTDMIARARAFDLDGIESEMGNRAMMAFLDRGIEGVEMACRRLLEATPSSGKDTWELWRSFTRQHEELVRGRGVYAGRCAFDAVYSDLSDYAVERFNEERYRLARDMFSWMRDRAREVGDDEAVELQAENVRVTDEAWDGRTAVRQERSGGAGGWVGTLLVLVAVSAGIRTCIRQKSSVDYQPNIQINLDHLRQLDESTRREIDTVLQPPVEPFPESPASP